MSKSFLQAGNCIGTERNGDFVSPLSIMVPESVSDLFNEFYQTEMSNEEFDHWVDNEIMQNTVIGKVIQSNLNGPYQGLGTISDKHGLYVMLKDMGYF